MVISSIGYRSDLLHSNIPWNDKYNTIENTNGMIVENNNFDPNLAV